MNFLTICFKKLRAMSGGRAAFALLLAAVLLYCAAVHTVLYAPAPTAIPLLVLDLDGTAESAALTAALRDADGLAVSDAVNEDTAQRSLALGRAEGLLVIGTGYAEALHADARDLCLHYESAPLSYAAQAVREIIAGKASAQRAIARAYADAEEALGALSAADRAVLEDYLALPSPENYTVRVSDGSSAAGSSTGAFTARYHGFTALGILLGMLCLSAFLGREDTKSVSRRTAALPGGRQRSRAGDAGALFWGGLLLTAAALFPAGWPAAGEVISFLCYDFTLTGLCLCLGRLGRSGRADVLSPFLVLLTGLVGGCFTDLSTLSPALSTLALFTPQGLLLAALSGSAFALPVLLCAGALGVALSCVEK